MPDTIIHEVTIVIQQQQKVSHRIDFRFDNGAAHFFKSAKYTIQIALYDDNEYDEGSFVL